MQFASEMLAIGNAIDVFGVIVIVLGILAASIGFIRGIFTADFTKAYTQYRQTVGRTILLGLEFLVAGDIVRTVAVSPTLTNIAVLAGIVLIRTFLSMTLQLEVDGRWPWQQNNNNYSIKASESS